MSQHFLFHTLEITEPELVFQSIKLLILPSDAPIWYAGSVSAQILTFSCQCPTKFGVYVIHSFVASCRLFSAKAIPGLIKNISICSTQWEKKRTWVLELYVIDTLSWVTGIWRENVRSNILPFCTWDEIFWIKIKEKLSKKKVLTSSQTC